MAVDYFLKIDGIEGESEDEKHAKEIEVIDFDWSEVQTSNFAQGGGGGTGKVKMENFKFRTFLNQSSPALMQSCAEGKHIKDAVFTCRKAGGGQKEYYKVTMEDVIIAGCRIQGANESKTDGEGYANGHPVEEISLNFGRIKWEYHAQKHDGSLNSAKTGGYDLKKNKRV
jgi:type VI secretion system secreted protein Hcp